MKKCFLCKKEIEPSKKRYVIPPHEYHRSCYFKKMGVEEPPEDMELKATWVRKRE